MTGLEDTSGPALLGHRCGVILISLQIVFLILLGFWAGWFCIGIYSGAVVWCSAPIFTAILRPSLWESSYGLSVSLMVWVSFYWIWALDAKSRTCSESTSLSDSTHSFDGGIATFSFMVQVSWAKY